MKPRIIEKNNKGQGVMEYVLLTGLIGIFCLGAIKGVGEKLNTKLKRFDNKVKTLKLEPQ